MVSGRDCTHTALSDGILWTELGGPINLQKHGFLKPNSDVGAAYTHGNKLFTPSFGITLRFRPPHTQKAIMRCKLQFRRVEIEHLGS